MHQSSINSVKQSEDIKERHFYDCFSSVLHISQGKSLSYHIFLLWDDVREISGSLSSFV